MPVAMPAPGPELEAPQVLFLLNGFKHAPPVSLVYLRKLIIKVR
jgi:hypothetical protein